MRYPMLQIDIGILRENAKIIKALCAEKGVEVAGVVKGAEAMTQVAQAFLDAGIKSLADSRMDHILRLRRAEVDAPMLLLRIPMISEVEDLVRHGDMSLNSEIRALRAIEASCEEQGKTHGVILMADLGDLREGFFECEELVQTALFVEKHLKRVRLMGVGTNLGCYGSIAPSTENLERLVGMAERIEREIGRPLEIISGGATSSLKLLKEGGMPPRINHLRIGEAILSARDLETYFDCRIEGLSKRGFILKAEVVEVKTKPTLPIGEMMVDAFGEKPVFEDKGRRKRAILAVGRKDFGQAEKLIPLLEGAFILGSSSDHLLLDIEECSEDVQIGDVLEFEMFYGPMLFLCGSASVEKVFVGCMKNIPDTGGEHVGGASINRKIN